MTCMNYWLFKSEPNDYSIDDLYSEPEEFGRWDGIRNYQARNLLRDSVKKGDGVLFYHSSCKTPAVVGTAVIVKEAYPDPCQFERSSKYFDAKATPENPRWFCVDVKFSTRFQRAVTLKEIKSIAALNNMTLVTRGRLSIQPVTKGEWLLINKLAINTAGQ